MTEFAVWAPRAQTGPAARSTATRHDDDAPARGGLVAGRRPRRAGAAPTTASCSTTTRPRCPTPARAGSPTACTPVAALRPRRVLLDRPAWTGRQLPGGVIYELHIGTFTAGGHVRRRDRAARPPGRRSASTSSRCCRSTPSTATATGATTASAGTPSPRTTAARTAFKRFVDACHAARARRGARRRLQPPRARRATYLDRFGPYFAEAAHTWGPTVNLDGPHSEQVRRYIIDNALMWLRDFHVDGLRLDAVHALHDTPRRCTCSSSSPIEVEALSAHVGRPLSLIAESDLNDARLVTAREAGGYGLHAQWTDDVHHSLHAVLTGEGRATTPTSPPPASPALAHVLTRAFLHEGTWSQLPRPQPRRAGRHAPDPRPPVRRLPAEPRPGRQPGRRRPARRHALPRPAGLRGGARVHARRSRRCCSWARSGGRAPRGSSSRTSPTRRCDDAVREGRRRSSPTHGWGADEVPDPQTPQTFLDSKLDWSEPRAGAARDACSRPTGS